MPSRTETLTPALLREWALPRGADSKYARGTVLVIGGARQTPGAALLAGTAALRVGAGRLSMAVAESVAVPLAIAVPESGVTGLAETGDGSVRGDDAGRLAENLAGAKAVVVGSGLDDGDEAERLVRTLLGIVGPDTAVLLDAYALGVVPRLADELAPWHGRLVLTPNKGEASRLLGRDVRDDGEAFADDLAETAERYGAVVTCFGTIAAPGGQRWRADSGQGGLGTSGSGDVLAGAIGGLLARGASPEQAACWGTHLHAAAGDRLTARVGPTGYLARELVDGLPEVLAELGQHA
ncbi:NAD(P)H-hydrate dehydratase [Cryobacterium tepidiphilum]|uniref:ADP-dependent (S)-NAD(P)H-hydrate dehydratase n=1 Tax=Cryobacterium tepidiphilum TaxID=2486026 RepID=A0A3M8KTS5_9MICO|nr:NAD(P)H-hydrate dehydratase [Cryobacterium tepidiphilum]RNE56653.1 NAD(P)H-hydrate dehydratase [Cryobacterium tepidiphilum]